MSEVERTDGTVVHVSIKSPEFLAQAVDAWFSIIESQFELKSITVSSTKFHNALSHMPPNIVSKIPRKFHMALSEVPSKNTDHLKSLSN